MKINQQLYLHQQWNQQRTSDGFDSTVAQLVLIFGASECISNPNFFNVVRKAYPNAEIVFSSTAGEIINDSVYDHSAVVTALQFDHTEVRSAQTNISEHKSSFDAGKQLIQQLHAVDLSAVFAISDGTQINGSEFVAGLNEGNTTHVPITGALAGDGARFAKTLVGLNAVPSEGNVVVIGFYGDKLRIGTGTFGGWDEFGHERTITKSNKNILHEIDGRNALDLYKEYLGPYVDELPGSALLFPLSIRVNDAQQTTVRTILSIDEEKKSMTFAGNLPEGSKVRLMKANFDKLVEGSSTAATYSFEKMQPQLAILISCVGRKLILQERIDEEVQAAKDIFGDDTLITGFYSYGEISPFSQSVSCELHNQTMTITTFSEL